MKVLQINTVKVGSTGKIMLGIAQLAKEKNIEAFCAVPVTKYNKNKYSDKNNWLIGTYYGRYLSMLLARITGGNGCFAWMKTRRFLKKLDKEKPDLLHFHNLHDSYINLPLLFEYVKKRNIPVVWTLHDCWSFTGHCVHFDMFGCGKWKTGCSSCPQYKEYPKSYIDNSKTMYKLKKKWFTGVQDMTLVTPSKWLEDLVKQSFLKDYPVKVINNGIDLSIFKPTESSFREKYGLEDKFILLGVAFGWGERKGLDVFIELSKRLDDSFQIVLVGADETVDKQLPNNIISIHRTQNQRELAEIYTAADLFVNPTREENFPTVNIESLACGTPVVTFKTGGSPEMLDGTCGVVVEKDDLEGLEREILRTQKQKYFSKEACICRASMFSADEKFAEYIELYKEKQK